MSSWADMYDDHPLQRDYELPLRMFTPERHGRTPSPFGPEGSVPERDFPNMLYNYNSDDNRWEPKSSAHGIVEPGNIDLTNRPRVHNPDGSISTVRSAGFNVDGKDVLLPTVSDAGGNFTFDQAVDNYRKTGKHLGVFDSPEHSTEYAKSLHEDQARLIRGRMPQGAPKAKLPLWAAEPSAVAAERPMELNNRLLVNTMRERYPDQGNEQIMESYRQDLGGGPTPEFHNGMRLQSGAPLAGKFQPDYAQGVAPKIYINSKIDPDQQLAAYPHELAHFGDQGAGGGDYFPPDTHRHDMHHRDFVSFEPQMAQSMDAQAAIENGLPVRRSVMEAYPWLTHVKANSSNRLASPWSF